MELIPQEPRRWARRWSDMAGACLVATFFMPHIGGTGDLSEPTTWQWKWEFVEPLIEAKKYALLGAMWLPPLAGLLAIVLARTPMRATRVRGYVLLLVACTTLVMVKYLRVLEIWQYGFLDERQAAYRVLVYAVTLAVALVAAGGHIHRCHVTKGRGLMGWGGGTALFLVLLQFTIWWPSGRPEGAWGWPVGFGWLWLAAILTMAVLGILAARRPGSGAVKLVGWAARSALLLMPVYVLWPWPFHLPYYQRDTTVRILQEGAASALPIDGCLILLALGLALVFEPCPARPGSDSPA